MTPLELPALTFLQRATCEIRRFELGDDDYGGLGQTTEYADPMWEIEYRLAGFPNRQARQPWQSFLDRVALRKAPVLAFDPNRRVPLIYYGDDGKTIPSSSPWGSPQIADYSRSESTFDLTGWSGGIDLTAGDYLSFQDTADRWHLHRLTADAAVSGAGAVTVEVTPRPARGLTHGNATLRIRDACCMARLTWSNADLAFGADNGAPLTVRASQRQLAFI